MVFLTSLLCESRYQSTGAVFPFWKKEAEVQWFV